MLGLCRSDPATCVARTLPRWAFLRKGGESDDFLTDSRIWPIPFDILAVIT